MDTIRTEGIPIPDAREDTDGRRRSLRRLGRPVPVLAALALLCALVLVEASRSPLQSWVFHRIARDLSFSVEPGPSDAIRFPEGGPYDERRGYVLLPEIEQGLLERGYTITAQARMSPRLLQLNDHRFYPVYSEKAEAGLVILDRNDRPIYTASFPERTYTSYDSIPSIVVRSLLYLENRELLEPGHPNRNPAIEWDRIGRAAIDYGLNKVGFHRRQPGGSTLATQIEKFRHSPEGRTDSPSEKFRQMAAATLRAYREGRNTESSSREIVLGYLNSVPLAAVPGYGEVNGLGDGLWAWFGADFRDINHVLAGGSESGWQDQAGAVDPTLRARRAQAYKRVLALFLAHRRPSVYLLTNREELNRETNVRLRLLANAGVIPPDLRDDAMAAELNFRTTPPARTRPSFVERKATNAIRTRLLTQLPLPNLYALDRLDLTVQSTLDKPTQERVAYALALLHAPAGVDSFGMRGARLLEKGDPAGVVYSFTLYEKTPEGNLLRVQADNLDQPLDINEGVKLDLGSTAKLRTLVHYLEIVSDLHAANAGRPGAELRREASRAGDPIRRWTFDWLASNADTSLTAVLEGAMTRRYSASPGERFMTGGGLHTFANFQKEDNGKVMSVAEGFRNSVNLVFIRLMRDVVRYHAAGNPAVEAGLLDDVASPERQVYLQRFADKEGTVFLSQFWKKYKGKSSEASIDLLVSGVRPTPRRLAAVFRAVRPDAPPEDLGAFLRRRLGNLPRYGSTAEKDPGRASAASGNAGISDALVLRLYEDMAPDAWNLADRGYIARVHPLELWLVSYLSQHPVATWSEVLEAGSDERQEVYSWLFRSKRKAAQDKRIKGLLEEDAFVRIHTAWARVGYPFPRLVPSYATAIGSSADRPAALAELMGILINDGLRLPLQRLEGMRFAVGTPFETIYETQPPKAERVLRPEVTRVVRRGLVDIVENGTARRAAGAFKLPDGSVIQIGGKTGTGDNRYETYAPGGRLISSKVVNRTATFVFLIGDRFYGTVSAHVPGPEAAGYVFTSSLPVQLLKALAPELMPLVAGSPIPTADAAAESFGG